MDKRTSLLGELVSYKESEAPGTVLTTFISVLAYELVQHVRAFHFTRLERLARDKRTSLLGPFVSYKENEVL
jgi:hypothetical protein